MRLVLAACAALAAMATADNTRPIIGILTLPTHNRPDATSYFPAVSLAATHRPPLFSLAPLPISSEWAGWELGGAGRATGSQLAHGR